MCYVKVKFVWKKYLVHELNSSYKAVILTFFTLRLNISPYFLLTLALGILIPLIRQSRCWTLYFYGWCLLSVLYKETEPMTFNVQQVQRPLLSFGPKASMKLATCPSNVCKVIFAARCLLYLLKCKVALELSISLSWLYSSFQELRLSSHLINEYGDEASLMIPDGASCTQWIKNLKKPKGSVIFSQENECRSNPDAFQFCGQPCSIPGSVLQLLGSSYLFRATAWEVYGRWCGVLILIFA